MWCLAAGLIAEILNSSENYFCYYRCLVGDFMNLNIESDWRVNIEDYIELIVCV